MNLICTVSKPHQLGLWCFYVNEVVTVMYFMESDGSAVGSCILLVMLYSRLNSMGDKIETDVFKQN